MKRIRILTGRHAGASLDLSAGNYSLGLDDDSDISITDWTHPPLALVVDDSGSVLARWTDESSDAEPAAAKRDEGDDAGEGGGDDSGEQSHEFTDFESHAFGDIVLCVGPPDQKWPADRLLLEDAFAPTPERVARWASTKLRKRTTSVVAGAAVLMLCAFGALGLTGSPKAARPTETVSSTAARVRSAVDQLGTPGIDVKVEGSAVVVSGRVETAEQAAKVRAAIDEMHASGDVTQSYSVASEVAESIRSSVGLAGAEVKHVGNGVFAITAEASDVQATRQAIERVVGDLGPVVRSVEIKLSQTAKDVPEMPILSSMKDDVVSVVQTRDGAKHLVVSSVDPLAAAREALSIPLLDPLARTAQSVNP
jgi:type III secretion protein D